VAKLSERMLEFRKHLDLRLQPLFNPLVDNASDLEERLEWVSGHVEQLDKNWAALHEGFRQAVLATMGLPADGGIREIVEHLRLEVAEYEQAKAHLNDAERELAAILDLVEYSEHHDQVWPLMPDLLEAVRELKREHGG
jgi:hypothetical protein